MSGAQGLDLLAPLKTTPKLEKIKARVRSEVPFFEEDAPFYEAIAKIEKITHEW
jgi:histidine ammonia-lyase